MKRPVNKDGTPRKQRTDCKINLLPDAGKMEFAAEFQKNPASPNVERLQAICRSHGDEWSAPNIYAFCPSCSRLISPEYCFRALAASK